MNWQRLAPAGTRQQMVVTALAGLLLGLGGVTAGTTIVKASERGGLFDFLETIFRGPEPAPTHLGSGPGVVAPNINSLALVAVVLAGVLAITEVFSGLRWPAVAALVASVVGWIAACGSAEVPVVSVCAWGVAWGATVVWFAVLAAQARSNR